MPSYRIEQKVRTLSENSVFDDDYSSPEFKIDDLIFRHWDFNHGDGWLGDAWIVIYELKASSAGEAYAEFYKKLSHIIPRISLVAQCYISFTQQPFMIGRKDRNFVFFRYTIEEDPVGLMFMEDNKEALEMLLIDETVPREFFLFWNDSVNTTGYTSKVLLMAAAIYALTKKPNGENDYNRIAEILGEDLKNEIFAPRTGVRHRLSHGEYLSEPNDANKNYAEMMHRAVIRYFNDAVFQKTLIHEDVVDPQRNFTGNISAGRFYVSGSALDLRSLVTEFDLHPHELSKVNYEFVYGEETKKF